LTRFTVNSLTMPKVTTGTKGVVVKQPTLELAYDPFTATDDQTARYLQVLVSKTGGHMRWVRQYCKEVDNLVDVAQAQAFDIQDAELLL